MFWGEERVVDEQNQGRYMYIHIKVWAGLALRYRYMLYNLANRI